MVMLDDFDRAAAVVQAVVCSVRDDQWSLPTACAEWDVRAVVNHLAHGNARVAEWAGAGPAAPPGDYLGADPPGAFTASVARAREVLAEPGLATRLVTTPLGDVPGSLLVHMRLNEYLAHGWDVADATGQPTDFVPDLAEQALESWRTRFGDQSRPPGGPFAPELPAPPDAAAADRLAAFLGRTPVRAGELRP
ncbi:TIGR03086 family metal-binding protein [Amycolatopsis sp. NPDC051372]|uniref:TIGR03086 family metal-binding protein n=1 Tax=Amycolatopsis sp. NPDC051372 TaxID=3155669 RepID=UPI00341D4A01